MSYTPGTYYRCTIIRGKTQTEMDDLLPAYAGIISEICPCFHKDFYTSFNNKLAQILYDSDFMSLPDKHKKTVRNHVTEVAGKLLGLYWKDQDSIIHTSKAAEKLLIDNDQPAFFKNLCFNFQFPNGSQKIQTIKERIRDGIKIKPFHYIIKMLLLAQRRNIHLTKKEIGYYILGDRHVLSGEVTPGNLLKAILKERKKGITDPSWQSGSRHYQHINEQINLLVLSNLIRIADGIVYLNLAESSMIRLFADNCDRPLRFDLSTYDLNDPVQINKMYCDWEQYYGSVSAPAEVLDTSIQALSFSPPIQQFPSEQISQEASETEGPATVYDIGEIGEKYVFRLEKKRVKDSYPRLENKVLLLGKQRGLGYDIASVEADEDKHKPEFARFIEVKTTKRTTVPPLNDSTWMDSVALTRKEWIAAQQYGKAYNIYRVYYTASVVVVRKINNPVAKAKRHSLEIVPVLFRMDFPASAIDKEYTPNA